MNDRFGRKINYLRISITDRCNLSCFYCKGMGKVVSHAEILRYEDMERLLRAACSLGIKKVRLTGGEPFLRRNFWDFLTKLTANFPELDFRITTNATLLAQEDAILRLKDLGIFKLNISLDTFSPKKFKLITKTDLLKNVLKAIELGLKHGLGLKINVVALKGINDDELEKFVLFACEHPVDVRFIEFMPIGQKNLWSQDYFWSSEQILNAIQKIVTLEKLKHLYTSGPATVYKIVGGKGRIGVISPLSNHFCNECNRLRITSVGRLRPCLFSDQEYKLVGLLRNPKISQNQLELVLAKISLNKPIGTELLKQKNKEVCLTKMVNIGG